MRTNRTLYFAGKLIQRWIFKTVSCCTINQTTPTRLYNTNITLDICSIIQSTAICLFADCHAIFYLRNYWHAGIFPLSLVKSNLFPLSQRAANIEVIEMFS